MKAFHSYWSFTAIRGALTLIVSVGILGLPYFAHALMTIPVVLALAIDVLAVYAMLDAGALFLIGTATPSKGSGRDARFVQAGGSVVIGAALYILTHGEFSQFLMLIVAAHATACALAEFFAARQTHRQYRSILCYASFVVLAACAITLPFASLLSVADQLFVLSTYVGLYGATQLVLGARMLFLEYRAEHPAPAFSDAWRAEMNNPLAGLPGRAEMHFASRRERTATAISRGYIVPGHGRIIPARQKAA